MYDLAIIGAGPAGATLARLVGPRFRVLLLDRRPLHRPAVHSEPGKCCGGLLAPDAQRLLAELGLALPADVLSGQQLFVVRSIDLPSGLERFYQRHYINMSRERFDRWLLSLAYGTEFRGTTRLAGFTVEPDHVSLRLREQTREYTECCRVLVGADGAASAVRRQLSRMDRPLPDVRQYLAVQQWLAVDQPPPYLGAIFDSQITDFYSWTIPKGDNLLVGSAVPCGPDAWRRLEALKAALANLGVHLGRCIRQECCLLNRPANARQLCLGSGRVALIGEAAGWISPSSAEGFSYAFASARDLAEALAPGPDGWLTRYTRLARPLRRNIAIKALKARLIYGGPTRRLVMRLGLSSCRVPPLFNTVQGKRIFFGR